MRRCRSCDRPASRRNRSTAMRPDAASPRVSIPGPRNASSLPHPAAVPDLEIRASIVACELCPRLRTTAPTSARPAAAPTSDQTYWARPVPGFGDPRARVLIARPRSRRPRRQPHRPSLHRRRLRLLHVPGPPRARLRQPAHRDLSRRRPHACATPGSPPSSAALRPATSPHPRRSATAPSTSPPRSPRSPASASSSASARSPGTATSPTCSPPASSPDDPTIASPTAPNTFCPTASTCSAATTPRCATPTPAAWIAPCSPASSSAPANSPALPLTFG